MTSYITNTVAIAHNANADLIMIPQSRGAQCLSLVPDYSVLISVTSRDEIRASQSIRLGLSECGVAGVSLGITW